MNSSVKHIIFAVLTLIWILEFFFFPSGKTGKRGGGKSFSLILSAVLISIAFSVISNAAGLFTLSGAPGELMSNTGLAVYTLGIFLRYWSIISIGPGFSRGISADASQHLSERGPYRALRHPLYLALLVTVTGVPLFLKSYGGFLLAVLIMSFALSHRIREEENILKSVIGERYLKWLSKRKFLL